MLQRTICIKIWLSMHPRNFGCVILSVNAYVVVNFLSQVIFVFFFLVSGYSKLCMLMKLKQKKKKNHFR